MSHDTIGAIISTMVLAIIVIISVFLVIEAADIINEDFTVSGLGVTENGIADSLNNPILNEVVIGLLAPIVVGISYIAVDYYLENEKKRRIYRLGAMQGLRIDDFIRSNDIIRANDWQQSLQQLQQLDNRLTDGTDKIVVNFGGARQPIKSAHRKPMLTMKPTLGLFDAGFEKFTKQPIEEQEKMLHELDYVEEVHSFNEVSSQLIINTGNKGRYRVTVFSTGKVAASRIEEDGSLTYRNPYIADTGNFHLCLGSGSEIFKKTHMEGNMYDCIRLIYKILISKNGRGHRTWSDCRYRGNF